MLEFRTPGFKGFGVKFSPFVDSRLAVATGQNFGLVGNGRLQVLTLTPAGIQLEKFFQTQDSLYDLAFSEANENHIYTASGDGTIKLFDTSLNDFPVKQWHEHGRDVLSVHYNLVTKTTFLTSSWDGTIKLYHPERDMSILSIPIHACTYSAQFSPHEDGIVSAVSQDGRLRVFDVRAQPSSKAFSPVDVEITPGASYEALTHDWNKYRSSVLAVGGVDNIVRVLDLRNLGGGPVSTLLGHQYAVRKLAWSPHLPDVLISGGYDMTARIWADGSTLDDGSPSINAQSAVQYGGGRQVGQMDRHTEFVMGMDWCMFGMEGWCATTAWDERVLVWDVRNFMIG